MEQELSAREAAIAVKEAELSELRKQAAQHPKELETSVARAIKETSERLLMAAKSREELLKAEAEGESNVFKARMESLERTTKEQAERITALTRQLEAAYQKVRTLPSRQWRAPRTVSPSPTSSNCWASRSASRHRRSRRRARPPPPPHKAQWFDRACLESIEGFTMTMRANMIITT